MRAVVRRGSRLVFDDIAEVEPGPGQVLVRTLCCGICGSDIQALHNLDQIADLSKRANLGVLDPARDVVFGHEFCAEVLDYGPGGERRFAPGTRVVSVPAVLRSDGLKTIGFSNLFPGGYAERMVLSTPRPCATLRRARSTSGRSSPGRWG